MSGAIYEIFSSKAEFLLLSEENNSAGFVIPVVEFYFITKSTLDGRNWESSSFGCLLSTEMIKLNYVVYCSCVYKTKVVDKSHDLFFVWATSYDIWIVGLNILLWPMCSENW